MDKKMNNDNTDYVSNESGTFRDYLNYLSMEPPSAQN